jgi:hypothetical protein
LCKKQEANLLRIFNTKQTINLQSRSETIDFTVNSTTSTIIIAPIFNQSKSKMTEGRNGKWKELFKIERPFN